MDQIMGKVGSYWMGQKAKSEMGTVTKEIDAVANNIDGGTKWLVNKIKGKNQKTLPDLLKEYNIPSGIFPSEATYDFEDNTKFLTVNVPSVCEVTYKDSSVVRFYTCVTAYMEKGGLTHIEGIKTKVMFIQAKVTSISCDDTHIHFSAGMKRTRTRTAYDVVLPGVNVPKF